MAPPGTASDIPDIQVWVALDDADVDNGCMLEAGGATVHLVGTLHRTGTNLSDRPRRAYIFNIGLQALADVSERTLERDWGTSARL